MLWDPSHRFGRPQLCAKAKYIKPLGIYLELEEVAFGFAVGKKMVEEERASRVEERIREIHVPVKIIGAGKGILVRGCKWYYRNAHKPKILTIIRDANHSFAEDGAEEKLFKETLTWLRRF